MSEKMIIEDIDIINKWMAGEEINGVKFALNEPVKIVGGYYRGQFGSVITITAFDPEPEYLVENPQGQDLKVKQSDLVKAI